MEIIELNSQSNKQNIRAAALTSSISRQAGGLFWSVRSLSRSLIDSGCKLQVFGGLDKYSEIDKKSWNGVPLTILPSIGPRAFGFQSDLIAELRKFQGDILHVHGLWMYTSIASLRWSMKNKPYVISPRGMLDPWAIKNSPIKKKLAGFLYENSHLKSAACIHALCTSEYEAIRNFGLKNPVAIIPNGIDIPDKKTTIPQAVWKNSLPPGSNVLFFLSRIHPKKGIVNLLLAWKKVKGEKFSSAAPWHLVIAGWDQGGHQKELEILTAELGITATVHFIGPLFDLEKAASFRNSDAFILPSFSEGLPMAVLEAWSYELPVLMTPQCNLPEGFSCGAAIRAEPDPQSLANTLFTLFEMSAIERKACGKRGNDLVRKNFVWPQIGEEMLGVYQWILGQRGKPDCVLIK